MLVIENSSLSIESFIITTGAYNKATVIIIDTTGKYCTYNCITTFMYIISTEFVIHPMSKAWYVNTTATLSCETTASSGIIRYQWRRVNGEITSDRANGVNTSTLTISSVTEQDEDEYYCVVNYNTVNGTLHNITSNKANIIVYGEQWTVYTFVNNSPTICRSSNSKTNYYKCTRCTTNLCSLLCY